MTPILSFTRGLHDGETVKLGEVVVGHVAPFIDGKGTRATFTVWLPECRRSQQPARSLASARANVIIEVERWLRRAGVFYPGQALEVQSVFYPGQALEVQK